MKPNAIYQGMSKAPWRIKEYHMSAIDVEAIESGESDFRICSLPYETIYGNAMANAKAIALAVNGTWSKGINPAAVEGLLLALKSIRRYGIYVDFADVSEADKYYSIIDLAIEAATL